MSTTKTNDKEDVKCELYSMTFVIHQEKEERKKLEHKKHIDHQVLVRYQYIFLDYTTYVISS